MRRQPTIIVADDEKFAKIAAERLMACIARGGGRAPACLTRRAGPRRRYPPPGPPTLPRQPPWDRVHWFMGDDRFVPAGDALSNMGMARRLFLDLVDVARGNIHPIATDAGSPDAAARLYEAELKHFYGRDRLDPAQPLFDLVLMGLGSDGHTASLFPNAPALDERERWVVGVERAGLAPFVPRVTLTLPALASTREMLFLVTGEDKRDILRRVLGGEDFPSSRVRPVGELLWLVGPAAAPEDHHAVSFDQE